MAGPSREKISRLLLTSHLRRTKRATLRQIRSTLGYLITADLSCEDVHEAVVNNEDLSSTSGSLGELAFGAASQDPLIQEWARLDPAKLVSPVVDRLLRSDYAPKSAEGEAETHSTFMRNHFLGLRDSAESLEFAVPNGESSFYKYIDEYIAILADPGKPEYKSRILKGVSRLIGAYGYDGPDLAVSQERGHSDWAVLKPSFEQEFMLKANDFDSQYVEFSPDLLILTHVSGAQLNISLDTAEVILGAADGGLFGDYETDAVRFDVEGFGVKLLRQVSENVIVVEPSGVAHEIRVANGKLTLIQSSDTSTNGGDLN
jgi:hypothetical protein